MQRVPGYRGFNILLLIFLFYIVAIQTAPTDGDGFVIGRGDVPIYIYIYTARDL